MLEAGRRLIYYGPLLRADRETAPSNLAFDRSLRSRDPAWGVRQLEAIEEVAAAHGLAREAVIAMPNNNTLLVLQKTRQAP